MSSNPQSQRDKILLLIGLNGAVHTATHRGNRFLLIGRPNDSCARNDHVSSCLRNKISQNTVVAKMNLFLYAKYTYLCALINGVRSDAAIHLNI